MIGRLAWLAVWLAIAVTTAFLQIDRQAAATPQLAAVVPTPFRTYSQPLIAAKAIEGADLAGGLDEARRLVRRRPIPAEHLTLLAVAQTKSGQIEQGGVTIQIAGQRGWREPLAQEAVLRIALAAGDGAEAARRYAALFLRSATPDQLLRDVGPAVLDETDGPGQRTLVDIISGTDRWNSTFLRRGVQVMPPSAFVDIASATIERGTRYDCGVLGQSVKGLRARNPAAAERMQQAAFKVCG